MKTQLSQANAGGLRVYAAAQAGAAALSGAVRAGCVEVHRAQIAEPFPTAGTDWGTRHHLDEIFPDHADRPATQGGSVFHSTAQLMGRR